MFGLLRRLNPQAKCFSADRRKESWQGMAADLAILPQKPPPLAGGRGGTVVLLRTATKGRKPQENQRQAWFENCGRSSVLYLSQPGRIITVREL